MKMKIQLSVLSGLLAVGILSGCSRNPVTGKKELVFMSEEKEKALGAESHPAVVATMGLYEDKNLQSFINEKGQAMAKISHRPELPFQFFFQLLKLFVEQNYYFLELNLYVIQL